VYEFGDYYPYYVLVMELLGPSLEDLFNLCNRRFSVRTVCLVADQLLQRIELFHSKSFLHRDIKASHTPHSLEHSTCGLPLLRLTVDSRHASRGLAAVTLTCALQHVARAVLCLCVVAA